MSRIAAVLALALHLLATTAEAQQSTIRTVAGGGAASFLPNGFLEEGSIGTIDAVATNPNTDGFYYASIPLNRVFFTGGAHGFVGIKAGTGFFGFSGDGGPATHASLAGPSGLALDAANNLLYIADTGNNRVRVINLNTGVINTAFGSGACDESDVQVVSTPVLATTVGLCRPSSIVRHANGTLYVFDSVRHVIWRVANEQADMLFDPAHPFAGTFSNGVPLTIGPFAHLGIDSPHDELWVSDVHGGTFAGARRIDLPSGPNICGLGCAETEPAGSVPIERSLSGGPLVAVDESTGDVYFEAIVGTHVVKRYQRSTDTIVTIAGQRGIGGAPFGQSGVNLANDVGLGRLTALAFFNQNPTFGRRDGLLIGEGGFLHRTNFLIQGDIYTIYGNGRVSFCGDGRAATDACLRLPSAVLVDTDGGLVIADAGNDVIRTVDANGVITSLPATQGAFGSLVKLAWEPSHGFAYVSSYWKNQVFLLDLHAGTFTPFAGNGCSPNSNIRPCGPDLGDGGPALSAAFARPVGVAVDAGGNLFIADEAHDRVRRVDAATQTITTVAGGGVFPPGSLPGQNPLSTALEIPVGLAFSASGNLLIAAGPTVLNVSPTEPGAPISGVPGEVVTIVAGPAGYALMSCPSTGDGGLAAGAGLCGPSSIAATPNTALIGELGRVRRVDGSAGVISLLAGGGPEPGDFTTAGDPVPAWNASFGQRLNDDGLLSGNIDSSIHFQSLPIDVTVAAVNDATGDRLFLYVADTANNRIRRIDLGPTLDGDVNHPPIADAGPNQSIVPVSSAPVEVVLAGTGSFDPDNDPLHFTWSENGQVLGRLPILTLTLAADLHIISLTVEDGRGGSSTTNVTVAILNTLSGFTTRLSDPIFSTGRFDDTYGAAQPIRLTFSTVDAPGVTSLTTRADFAPPPPAGQQAGTPPFYYDIQTTAVLGDAVRLCLDTNGMSFARPASIQLYRLDDGDWIALSNQESTQFGELCGDTQSLGTFAIFYPEVPATVMTRIAGTSFAENSLDGPGGDARDDVVDGGAATASAITRPTYLAVDRARRLLYTTDSTFATSRVRRIDLNTGTISTVLGPGTFAGQSPIALDPSGNSLYYVDNVDPAAGAEQVINKLELSTGTSVVVGANGPDISALVTDSQGNLFVAHAAGGTVLRVDAATGAVTQVLNETGHPATGILSTPFFDQPRGLAFDREGHLLVGGTRLVRVSPGADGTVNGSADETVTWIGGLLNLSPPSSLPPFLGDGLHPTLAVLLMYQMFVAADGAVVFGDGYHVRRISAGSDGVVNGDGEERISTIAGFYAPYAAGGRAVATERYASYRGVVEDPIGGGVIVADYAHQLLTFGLAAGGTDSGHSGADLAAAVTALSDEATIGSTLSYRVVISNNGPARAEHVSMTMPVSAAELSSANATSPAGFCVVPLLFMGISGQVTCDAGSIPAHGTVVLTVDVMPKTLGHLTSTITVSSDQLDPVAANNTAVVETPVVDRAAPTAAISAAASIAFGSNLTADANGSTDAGGGHIVRYLWRLIEGGLSIETAAPIVTFAPPPAGTHHIELIVVDDSGNQSAPAIVVVQVIELTVSDDSYTVRRDSTLASGPMLVTHFPQRTFTNELYSLTNVNGTLFFADGIGNLRKSDGTPAGTTILAAGAGATSLTSVNGTLFFTKSTSESVELWKSDGTESGTVLVRAALGYPPRDLTSVDGTLYFVVSSADATGELVGDELWRSDGTSAGTWRIKAFSPASRFGYQLTGVGRSLYLSRGGLFKSDGTPDGTVLVNPVHVLGDNTDWVLPDHHPWYPNWPVDLNGTLIFYGSSALGELWKSDAVNGATVLVPTSAPQGHDRQLVDFAAVAGKLYFGILEVRAMTPEEEQSLGPCPILLLRPDGTCSRSTTAWSREVWTSDGTSAGTSLLKTWIPPLLTPVESTPFTFTAGPGNTAFFLADGALWNTDGTSAGTLPVAPLGNVFRIAPDRQNTISNNRQNSMTSVDGTLFVVGSQPGGPTGIWRSDGTPGGTLLIKAVDGYGASDLTSVNGALFYQVPGDPPALSSPGRDRELWVAGAAPSLLANDTVHAAQPVSVTVGQPVSHGTLVLDADGTFTYRPNAGFVGDDTFTYTISDGTMTSNPATVTIHVTSILPALTVGDAATAEGNAGDRNLVFTVTRTGDVSVSSSVDFDTSGGSATAGVDYDARTGSLTFAPGETAKQVTVPVHGDTVDEDDELFFVTLSNAVGATLGRSRALGRIVNDDFDSDLGVAATATPDPVAAGDTLNYQVVITNNGPRPATGVTLTMPVDPGTISSVSASSPAGQCVVPVLFLGGAFPVTCDAGALASGASVTLSVTVTPKSAGQIASTFGVSAEQTDRVPANNALTVQTLVSPARRFVDRGGVWYDALDSAGTDTPVVVRFAAVTASGILLADLMSSPPAPPAEYVFVSPVFNISTTASVGAPITICITGAGFSAEDRLFHFDGARWGDITDRSIGSSNQICGQSLTLSPFAIGRDVTAPHIESAVTPEALWPPNGKMVPVVLSGRITDGASGVDAASAVFRVVDEYHGLDSAGAVRPDAAGRFSVTLMLEASRQGTDRDGRQYQIVVTASDRQGNRGSASIVVVVPHDRGK